uniref:Uncharacterized protein n=1 Tax=viral metagenome TaxID=1070528 RepID=A0A6C0L7D0_9ZZZZ
MAFGIKMESVQKRLGGPILGIVATRPARLLSLHLPVIQPSLQALYRL